MWLRQLCAGQDAKAAGLVEARESGSATQIEWWAQHQPIVTALMHSADIVVACDPERATYADGPAVIWAWAATKGDIVYGFGMKRRFAREMRDFAKDLATELLGDRLTRSQMTVMDLVDLAALRMIPPTWRRERGWISSLRQLSQRHIEHDATFLDVARHVLDPNRAPWVPSSRRAA